MIIAEIIAAISIHRRGSEWVLIVGIGTIWHNLAIAAEGVTITPYVALLVSASSTRRSTTVVWAARITPPGVIVVVR